MEALVAQCALQPHLGQVVSDILLQSRESGEFYVKVGGVFFFPFFLFSISGPPCMGLAQAGFAPTLWPRQHSRVGLLSV